MLHCENAVLCSGGLDSTVLLTELLQGASDPKSVLALHITYGSVHEYMEGASLADICGYLDVTLHTLQVPLKEWGFESVLLQNAADIPEGPYKEENVVKTAVPFRNGIFIAIAAGFVKEGNVHIATHAGDHPIYPDCSPRFLHYMFGAVSHGTAERVRLMNPYSGLQKWQIVQKGASIGAPMSMSYSCYKGGDVHCGVCPTCLERREAFVKADVKDLTEYMQ